MGLSKQAKECLKFYDLGFREGATSVLKALNNLISSYLTDYWKGQLFSRTKEIQRIWKSKKEKK